MINYNRSLNEKKVGTWIDGKSIYERTFKMNGNGVIFQSNNIDKIIYNTQNIMCYLDNEGTIQMIRLSPTNAYYYKSQGLITNQGEGTQFYNYITIGYTKRSD